MKTQVTQARTRVYDAYTEDFLVCRNVLPQEMRRIRGPEWGARCNTVALITDFPVICSFCKARIA